MALKSLQHHVDNLVRGRCLHTLSVLLQNYQKVSADHVKSLKDICGALNVSLTDSVRDHHSHDESSHLGMPEVVVFPETTKAVSSIMHYANQNLIPVIPFGTGTGLEGGAVAVQGGISLDLSKINKVTAFHPEDFDATVQPGVTRLQLNNFINKSGLWFPIDPGADASLCGMVATSASGTTAVRYGTMRENVLNLEVVTASGQVMNTAGSGRRTKKSVAGYNLTNLICGSEGTLGVITAATLRLHPMPEVIASAVCSFNSILDAIKASTEILQSGIPVARVELMDDISMKVCNDYFKMEYAVQPSLFLEFHGSQIVVDEYIKMTSSVVSDNSGSNFRFASIGEERNKLWFARHNMYYALRAQRPKTKCYITDICVPISYLADVVTLVKDDSRRLGLLAPIIGHVGDGNFHCVICYDPNDADETNRSLEFKSNMVRHALEHDGTCTGEHGVGLGKAKYLEAELGTACVEVMKTVKRALDPNMILNPGKIFMP